MDKLSKKMDNFMNSHPVSSFVHQVILHSKIDRKKLHINQLAQRDPINNLNDC